jgi:hypothetical protein
MSIRSQSAASASTAEAFGVEERHFDCVDVMCRFDETDEDGC